MEWKVTTFPKRKVHKHVPKEELHNILYNDVQFKNGTNTADKLFKSACKQEINDCCMSGRVKIIRTQ